MAVVLRCWDSSTILGVLLAEEDKLPSCLGTLQAAEEGRLRIVVSALALPEVLMLRGHAYGHRERAQVVHDFFEHSWIAVRPVDLAVGKLAQECVWDHGIGAKDAIHVATALRFRVPNLDTFDGPLTTKGQAFRVRGLTIGRPDIPLQGSLAL